MCVGASKAHQMLQVVRHLLVPHHQTQSQCHPHVCFFWFHNFFYNWKLFSFLICDGTFKVQEMLLKPSCQTPTICAQTTRQMPMSPSSCQRFFLVSLFSNLKLLKCYWSQVLRHPLVAHQPQDTMSKSPSSCQRIILGFMIFQWLMCSQLSSAKLSDTSISCAPQDTMSMSISCHVFFWFHNFFFTMGNFFLFKVQQYWS